ncbi:LLM class flavin-dependent oxidoreductase [Prauserella halophila]|uniref:LLM class flavin-dependent oxidoreductase n=1 Tax=Prauserella halophila TaxID=185641 RepID=A0ABN1WH48_9PSEU|nr:LLM class flavin-dependent oxidoreductase [Prauserella halophila]MCP2238248.1 Flavin-dependent oxidoreductase, luciferase family (includes alkanesulfonate monooxygenase SsuD and methylene tetrahydromethanopterin reductase) [Prauserella halophila]
MEFGIFLLGAVFGDDPGAALQTAADAVRYAEHAGFDEAWIAEHHFMSYGTCPSAITFAGHALGATSRITVGTAVSVLSTVHPVALAEQTRMLDRLSGGRFALGVGRGGPWVDLEVFGTGVEAYEQHFAERLDLLLTSLTDDHVRGDGPSLTFREVPLTPPALTRPHPPVTVACTSADTATLAAERGLPMLLGMHASDDDKARTIAAYDRAAARAGGALPARHTSTVVAHVGADRASAVDELRSSLPRWLTPGLAGYIPVDDRPRTPRDPMAYAELLCDLHPVGDPAYCIDRLRTGIAATGADRVLMLVEGGGSRERTLATIERLGAEVLPALRESRPNPT